MWFAVVEEAFLDTLKTLPFLFAAFLIVEWLEHSSNHLFQNILKKTGKAGPAVGALLGCIPQCGFSVLSSNLFAAGLISAGTLLAVYLSTSDEAVLILLTNPESMPLVGRLLLCKVILGAVAGTLVNILLHFLPKTDHKEIHDLCDDCGCDEHAGILRPALRHTGKIALFLFLASFVLGEVMAWGEKGVLERILLTDSLWQPCLTALAGLIPNCAASVILTRLFLEGAISFGSAVAGLASGAGVGLLILFRVNRNRWENIRLTAALYLLAVAGGMILQSMGI